MVMNSIARLFLVMLVAFKAFAAEPAVKPHIVFILTDDMGSGDLGCYGGTVAPTPNIDRLAHEGIRFTRYYSASPICSPSRAGLLTGQFPARWRITSFLQTRAGNRECEQVDFLDPAAPSLARALQAAGYATAHIGKWHLGGGTHGVCGSSSHRFTKHGLSLWRAMKSSVRSTKNAVRSHRFTLSRADQIQFVAVMSGCGSGLS
jgi:arylsulfatase A-like enzyme